MAFVQEPAEPVHHPAVHDIGEGFHRRDGSQEQEDADCPMHGVAYSDATTMLRRLILPATLLALAGCSTPEAMTRTGLVNAGIPRATAACMADRMVDRLSLLQLRRLSGLAKARGSKGLNQFLYRVRSLKDPEILGVVSSSAGLCATGLAG